MSKNDYSSTEHDIPVWENHEDFQFKSNTEMLEWVRDDKVNFKLSDKVYEAMIDCLERGINETIVATISVFEQTKIDVVIRKPNFQKILSSYVDRLLEAENYEKLALIKSQIQKFDLEITK